jgi:hypothetical protein
VPNPEMDGSTPVRTEFTVSSKGLTQVRTSRTAPPDQFAVRTHIESDLPPQRSEAMLAERGWRVTRPEAHLRGGTSREEGDGVDLDLRVQQQAGDLHGGARGRVFRKELSADA